MYRVCRGSSGESALSFLKARHRTARAFAEDEGKTLLGRYQVPAKLIANTGHRRRQIRADGE